MKLHYFDYTIDTPGRRKRRATYFMVSSWLERPGRKKFLIFLSKEL